jgi:alpha-L-rhamnosidase
MQDMLRARIICLFVLVIPINIFAQLRVDAALCENKLNPLGVDVANIHFGWELDANENSQFQTAYQVGIASSVTKLQSGDYDVWNSSVVRSGQNVLVEYKGRKMEPAQTYYWRVKVWDKHNKPSAWSAVQQFITGLPAKADWANAKWIGYEELADSMRVVPGIHAPLANTLGNKCLQRPVVPLFRKQFNVNKQVAKALLFITGLGQYEASMNGTKVGNSFLRQAGPILIKQRCITLMTLLHKCWMVIIQ